MGRKELQGLAKNAAQIFAGYQLYFDLPQIATWQSGKLEIDYLAATCRFGGQPVGSLRMAESLRVWFVTQAKRAGVPLDAVSVARLTIHFSSRHEPAYVHKGVQHWATIVAFACDSRITAHGRDYVAQERGSGVYV